MYFSITPKFKKHLSPKTTPLKFIPKLEEGFLRKVDEADGEV
jgi:hypothetical protein